MAGKRITLQLQGSPEDEGDVRLGVFLSKLRDVMAALAQTERLVSGKTKRSVYYRIVDLSRTNPTRLVIEATAHVPTKKKARFVDYSEQTVNRFFENVNAILRENTIPEGIDIEALEAYKKLGDQVGEYLSQMLLLNGAAEIDIDSSYMWRIDDLLDVSETVWGSFSGRFERLDLHNKREFAIFPLAGPTRIRCIFENEIEQKVLAAIKNHVRVYGEIQYKGSSYFPAAIYVNDIEVLPPTHSLPSLHSLKGIMPNLKDGRSTEDFLGEIRNGE